MTSGVPAERRRPIASKVLDTTSVGSRCRCRAPRRATREWGPGSPLPWPRRPLLRRRVSLRSTPGRRGTIPGRAAFGSVVVRPSEPEVDQLDRFPVSVGGRGRQQHVVGLEVAVDDPRAVQVDERLRQFEGDGGGPWRIENALVDAVLQRAAVDPLEHQIRPVPPDPRGMDGDHPRVGQSREQPRLAERAVPPGFAVNRVRGEELDGDRSADRRVAGTVDRGHAAPAVERDAVIPGDGRCFLADIVGERPRLRPQGPQPPLEGEDSACSSGGGGRRRDRRRQRAAGLSCAARADGGPVLGPFGTRGEALRAQERVGGRDP